MVIYGIVGRPNARLGSAKSTLLTWLALTYQAKFNQKIVSNYHIKVNNFQFLEHPRELINLYNSFIAIDDIYRWLGFDNMRAKKVSKLMAGEIRHHNNNMAWVSSRLKDYVHKSLREHSDYLLFPTFNKYTGWVHIDVLDACYEEVPIGVIPRNLNPNIVKKVWSFYNHREDIAVTDYF
jgi:hypothetical protein